jgi:hypothetical protein
MSFQLSNLPQELATDPLRVEPRGRARAPGRTPRRRRGFLRMSGREHDASEFCTFLGDGPRGSGVSSPRSWVLLH